jgi:hypothetical protein
VDHAFIIFTTTPAKCWESLPLQSTCFPSWCRLEISRMTLQSNHPFQPAHAEARFEPLGGTEGPLSSLIFFRCIYEGRGGRAWTII